MAQTCQLALQRIQYHNQHDSPAEQDESRYLSVDPTPAAPSSTPADELRSTLLDEKARIFDRYGAMFALRNKGGKEAVSALGEAFLSGSALLKHEVAYVLGQMQDAEAVTTLRLPSRPVCHVLRYILYICLSCKLTKVCETAHEHASVISKSFALQNLCMPGSALCQTQ